MDALERALADMTDWVAFERLCCRVLNSEGFRVDPRGGSKDEGRDAVEGDQVTFQYSLQEDVPRKLGKEITRYEGSGKRPREYVFVTNQSVSADTKDRFATSFGKLGIKLHIFDRSWLSAKIGSPKLKDLRDELLASTIITAPDTVRIALSGPLRNAMLGALDEGTKDTLTDERLGRVRALMKARALAEAEKVLREVLEQANLPVDQRFEAHLHLGNVMFHQGRVDEAQVEWEHAIETAHPNALAAANLATSLLVLQNKPAQARAVITRGLETDPRFAGLINLEGLYEWGVGNTGRALELFRQAYAVDERPEHLLNIWNLQAELGTPPADEDIRKATERFPTHKELLLMLANRLIDHFQEKHDPAVLQRANETISRALSDFLPVLEKHKSRTPFSPLDWEWIGCALNTFASIVYWSGDHRRAEELVKLAMLFDDAPLLSFTLGQVLSALGRYSEAVASYEAAAARGFDKGDLWLQLGNSHYILYRQSLDAERLQRAAYCYDRASRTLPFALTNLAQLHWDVGRKDHARELIAQALKACPNEPVVQCNALIYACDGDPTRVLAGMGEIEAQHPTNATVLTVIGDACYQLGEWGRAFAYFSRAADAAGPHAALLEQLYPRAADALTRTVGGDEGSVRAMEFLLKAMDRLPGNRAIEAKLEELSRSRAECGRASRTDHPWEVGRGNGRQCLPALATQLQPKGSR
jgi:tetratricopeptide (TPR) repeat protein